jgi:hypothetical protein
MANAFPGAARYRTADSLIYARFNAEAADEVVEAGGTVRLTDTTSLFPSGTVWGLNPAGQLIPSLASATDGSQIPVAVNILPVDFASVAAMGTTVGKPFTAFFRYGGGFDEFSLGLINTDSSWGATTAARGKAIAAALLAGSGRKIVVTRETFSDRLGTGVVDCTLLPGQRLFIDLPGNALGARYFYNDGTATVTVPVPTDEVPRLRGLGVIA